MKQRFEVGDRVVLEPNAAAVFEVPPEDLRRVHVVTKVEQSTEDDYTERIWLDDQPEPQWPTYYLKIRR